MPTAGLDLGGTWVRAVSLEDDGEVSRRLRQPTPEAPGEAATLLHDLWRQVGGGPAGLASAPELDADGTVLRWGSRPDWRGAAVLAELHAAGAAPWVVDDVSAAAVAEHWSGDRPPHPSTTVLVALGTGLGAGAVIEDRPWLGARGRALDLGHLAVPAAAGRACGCGRNGCLQTLVSGSRFAAHAAELGLSPEAMASAPAAAAWRAGFVAALVEGLGQVQRLLDPHRLVLGGGLGEALFAEVEAAWRGVGEGSGEGSGGEPPLEAARWGTWGGAVGAAVAAAGRRGVRIRRLREQGSEPSSEPRLTVAVVQGPNLDLLGEREPEHYGTLTLGEIEDRLLGLADELGVRLVSVQSNHQGELVDWLRDRRRRLDGALVNPAGLTAHGYPLRDALTGCEVPFVEVHLSNLEAREAWHRESCFAAVALGRVSGLGADGYEVALRALVRHLRG